MPVSVVLDVSGLSGGEESEDSPRTEILLLSQRFIGKVTIYSRTNMLPKANDEPFYADCVC